MAKTIKEMAKEYGEENPNIVFSADDVSDDTESPALDFEAGANAVLDVLSPIILSDEPSNLIVDRLLLTIADLKG